MSNTKKLGKTKLYRVISIICLISVALIIAGCGQGGSLTGSSNHPIVGVWERDNGDIWVFFSDGNLHLNESQVTYSIEGNILATRRRSNNDSFIYEIEIKGNTLTLTPAYREGSNLTFTRIK